MFNKETFLAILALVSVSIAQNINISGRVTNSDGEPISDASVELENEGITATTDTDGLFSLISITPIFNSRNNKRLPNILNASFTACFAKVAGVKEA